MKIRIAEVADLVFLSQYDRHISKAELENIIKLKRIYIAQQGEKIVGWLRYNLFWDNIPFMNMLFVLDEYRGQGTGRELVSVWEESLRNNGCHIVMTSSASDEYAQHFYNKLGYKAVGGFTPNGDPYEIIFEKLL